MHKLLTTWLITALAFVTTTLAAAPVGYSINSDSATSNADSLYRIDLATGEETRIAKILSLGEARIDVEGLAFAPDGTLYGVDDEARTLFPINPDNGVVDSSNEVPISGLQAGSNDFGMTFACDDTLYITSVSKGSLYKVNLDGITTLIGAEGSLGGVKISALAAYGDPVKLYGLGNGMNENQQVTTPNLYEIDITDGTIIQSWPLGNEAGKYSEGGLSFDDSGQLWAITDRRALSLPSQLMKLDLVSPAASAVNDIAESESGFESLAITVPRGCATQGGDYAYFKVQKQFIDGNDETPATFNISCNAGTPLTNTITVQPDNEPLGALEVTFSVTNFEDGALDCRVWEETPENYSAVYECFSDGNCTATESECSFLDTSLGQDNLCVIRNYPAAVEVIVANDWVYDGEGPELTTDVTVALECRNFIAGDGNNQGDSMYWSWVFGPDTVAQTATVYPVFPSETDSTECQTVAWSDISAVSSYGLCTEWTPVIPGTDSLDCTVTSTIVFEGIPTLNRSGLILASLLMLLTGLVFVRRF